MNSMDENSKDGMESQRRDRPGAIRGHDVASRRRRSRQGLLRAPRLAARHRFQAQPGHSGRAVHATGLAGVDPGGQGTTTMSEPLQGLFLVVEDIEARRKDLISRGAEVSEIWHIEPGRPRSGLDPERRSYFSRASFADPDGNTWVLQEITERLPGRGGGAGLRAAGQAPARDRRAPRRVRGDRPAA